MSFPYFPIKAFFFPLFRFSAHFDFRTYDSEGVVLYAESLDHSAWFLIALRDGKIEIQFKNEFTTKIISGGKVINNGHWNMVGFTDFTKNVSTLTHFV